MGTTFSPNIQKGSQSQDKIQAAKSDDFGAIFEHVEEGIVIFDHRGNITVINPAATKLTKYSKLEAVGQHFNKIVKLVSAQGAELSALTPIYTVLDDGVSVNKSQQLLESKTGQRIWVELGYAPIDPSFGFQVAGIAIIKNIQGAQQLEEVKNDFISIVSHELRNSTLCH